MFKLSQIWPGALFGWLESHKPVSYQEHPCFLAWQDVSNSSCPCFDLCLDEAISPRSSGSLEWRAVCRDHTLGARDAYFHSSFASGPFQWKEQEIMYFFVWGKKKFMSFYCFQFTFGLIGFLLNFFDFKKKKISVFLMLKILFCN